MNEVEVWPGGGPEIRPFSTNGIIVYHAYLLLMPPG